MPYLLLAIGVLIGLYTLYRFVVKASIPQIKALIYTAFIAGVVIATFFLAVTGRLPAAIAVAATVVPLVYGYIRSKKEHGTVPPPSKGGSISSRAEALEILNLEDGASDDEIKAAYKKLMAKVHPDHEGSEWMAAKLNEARDFLLQK